MVREPAVGDPPLVLMDTDQMTQVFLNILINAIDATPAGGKVFVRYATDDRDRLQIIVEDTGEGIPRDNQDKIFDPFLFHQEKGNRIRAGYCQKHNRRTWRRD